MSLSTNRDRPVLARLECSCCPGGHSYDCHATGETGDCGHPLAECPSPGCPGSFCPTCGAWLCPECQGLRDAVRAMLAGTAGPLL